MFSHENSGESSESQQLDEVNNMVPMLTSKIVATTEISQTLSQTMNYVKKTKLKLN